MDYLSKEQVEEIKNYGLSDEMLNDLKKGLNYEQILNQVTQSKIIPT